MDDGESHHLDDDERVTHPRRIGWSRQARTEHKAERHRQWKEYLEAERGALEAPVTPLWPEADSRADRLLAGGCPGSINPSY